MTVSLGDLGTDIIIAFFIILWFIWASMPSEQDSAIRRLDYRLNSRIEDLQQQIRRLKKEQ